MITKARQMSTAHPATPAASGDAPRPALSVFDAVMIIVGIVIGGGIYALPPAIAGLTGSFDWMLIAWALSAWAQRAQRRRDEAHFRGLA